METKDKSAIENDAEEEITDSEIGDWAVVQYDKQMYPGEITDAFNKKVVVSAMLPAGNCFKWSNRKDEWIYPFSAVFVKINPPTVASRKGQFSFDYFN